MPKKLVYKLAKSISDIGGNVYFVGGYVRDEYLNRDNKDIDIEVYGISPEQLKCICQEFGNVDEIGVSFGILKIKGIDIDIAMPRTEKKIGHKHTDFSVSVDPYMSTKEASKRRDFTINALMRHVLSGEIIDHYGGLNDLNNKIIRHINDETFIEDPLRVYRAAGFASRLDFKIAPETMDLCKKINESLVAKERVYEETNKVLLKSTKPSIYFNMLREMNQLKRFPDLERLIDIPQNPTWHPEGDVWNHTMEVIDKAALVRDQTSFPLGFMYAALLHDIGKADATTKGLDGQIRSLDHEAIGAQQVPEALSRLTTDVKLKSYVQNLVKNHMTPHFMTRKTSEKTTNRYLDRCIAPKDSIILSYIDTSKANREELALSEDGWWDNRLAVYEKIKKEPEVTGRDLIKLGYKPGPMFKKIIEKCHQIHLAGVSKEDVIKQLPGIVKGIHQHEENAR